MANARKDNNGIETMTGVLNTDGVTVTLVKADPAGHIIDVSDASTGSDFGSNDAARDANKIPVWLATSEDDGTTPVPVYVNSSGQLLIDSN